MFLSPGERGAKGDPGEPGVGLRGQVGPAGIPGRSGRWALRLGRALQQGVSRTGQPSPLHRQGPWERLGERAGLTTDEAEPRFVLLHLSKTSAWLTVQTVVYPMSS